MATRAAAASDASVVQAARNALAAGNAVDAVVAGVLVAAAGAPGVLLGPLQALVAGAGAGLLAVDGRARQPGLGLPRPRGSEGAAGAPAASVAVPGLPAGLATLLASAGTRSWRQLGAPAVRAARALSVERAAVLDALGRHGVPAMATDALFAELAAVAGRSVGGSLTREDLSAVRPALTDVEVRSRGPEGWLGVPWAAAGLDASRVEVVAAADGHGLVCIACYEVCEQGVPVPALGLLAPPAAAPVLRGERRVRPGDPRPAAAPIALRVRAGLADLAAGLAREADAEAALEALLERLEEAALVSEALEGTAGRPVVVVRTRREARAAASA